MAEAELLLELIEKCIVEHGGDLGGWTLRLDGSLKLFDGRVTLRVEMRDAGQASASGAIHAHVFATLHEHDDEELDACLFGMGGDVEASLGQAAAIWMTGVAGPIRSFLDDRPVCMTCRVGVAGGDLSAGDAASDYGLPGLRAFVGPSISRGLDDEQVAPALDDSKPWFRFAAESAAPRRVHLAKVSVISKGEAGWSRDLEIDGHDVTHHDPDWPATVFGPEFGYLTRFAVFEFPRNSAEIRRRAELERTIRHFAENFARHPDVDDLVREMNEQGFDPVLVHEAESISTIAFARTFFEPHGVQFAPTVIRARGDGQVQVGVPLMSIPAYSRARALAVPLRAAMPPDEFQSLCLYNAESNAILKAMEAHGDKLDLSQMKLYPCVVPDRDVDQPTMDAALATLHQLIEDGRAARAKPEPHPPKKPWWKLW